ncbi:MAG: hypothetical protein ACJ74C_13875 [Gaiellaceae bacterium]
MKRFWSRQPDRPSAADWPEPRPEFLASVADHVRSARGHRERGNVRFALAGVVALAALVAVSAFGGVGYAARKAENAVSAVSGPLSSDSSKGTVGQSGFAHRKPKHDDDDNGYDDKCKDLKKQLKELKRAHIREWHALLAQQRLERKNFSGRKGSPAWHALLKKQWSERRALKREQHAERKELKAQIKKCKKDRHDDDDDDDDDD